MLSVRFFQGFFQFLFLSFKTSVKSWLSDTWAWATTSNLGGTIAEGRPQSSSSIGACEAKTRDAIDSLDRESDWNLRWLRGHPPIRRFWLCFRALPLLYSTCDNHSEIIWSIELSRSRCFPNNPNMHKRCCVVIALNSLYEALPSRLQILNDDIKPVFWSIRAVSLHHPTSINPNDPFSLWMMKTIFEFW